MLVDKGPVFKDGEIVAFRLITGDEIIGKVVGLDKEEVHIEHPLTLIMTNQGASFAPASFMSSGEKPIAYSRVHIVARMAPHSEVEAGYRSATGGIQVAPQGLVVPKSR